MLQQQRKYSADLEDIISQSLEYAVCVFWAIFRANTW